MNLYQEVALSFKKVGDPWSRLAVQLLSKANCARELNRQVSLIWKLSV